MQETTSLFGHVDKSLSTLSQRVISFVHNYRAAQERDHVAGPSLPPSGTPPTVGFYKLNFDGGRLRESSWGHDFVILTHLGDITLAGVEQGPNCGGPLIEEGRACLLGLRYAKEVEIANLIVEGDCLTLISSSS